jgi:hypothetical protein
MLTREEVREIVALTIRDDLTKNLVNKGYLYNRNFIYCSWWENDIENSVDNLAECIYLAQENLENSI